MTGGDEHKARLYIEGMVGAGAFESDEYLETVPVYRGRVGVKTYTVSRLRGYMGLDWTPRERHY